MLFVVISRQGPAWEPGRALREQDAWSDHAAFMDALADEGFVLLAGPLGTGSPVHRAMLIVDADSEAAIHTRLEDDPWTPMQILEVAAIEPWDVLLGALPARKRRA